MLNMNTINVSSWGQILHSLPKKTPVISHVFQKTSQSCLIKWWELVTHLALFLLFLMNFRGNAWDQVDTSYISWARERNLGETMLKSTGSEKILSEKISKISQMISIWTQHSLQMIRAASHSFHWFILTTIDSFESVCLKTFRRNVWDRADLLSFSK